MQVFLVCQVNFVKRLEMIGFFTWQNFWRVGKILFLSSEFCQTIGVTPRHMIPKLGDLSVIYEFAKNLPEKFTKIRVTFKERGIESTKIRDRGPRGRVFFIYFSKSFFTEI